MPDQSYKTEILLSAAPERVYTAITEQVNDWWTIHSNLAPEVGDQLSVHFEKGTTWVMTVMEALPDRRLVWKVADAHHDLDNVAKKDEWAGTTIIWEIEEHDAGCRLNFMHEGLVQELECYEICHAGWDYFLGSLKAFLETGTGYPFTRESS